MFRVAASTTSEGALQISTEHIFVLIHSCSSPGL